MIDVEHADHTRNNFMHLSAFFFLACGIGAGEEYNMMGDGTGVGEDFAATNGCISGDGICYEQIYEMGVEDQLRMYLNCEHSCARGL